MKMSENLWKETIQKLKEHNLSFDDVVAIYGNDFQITKENFEEVAKKTNYYSGYGGQEVASDLKILGNNFIMTRGEYDGSEWWELMYIGISIPKEVKKIEKLASNGIGWVSLSNLNKEVGNEK